MRESICCVLLAFVLVCIYESRVSAQVAPPNAGTLLKEQQQTQPPELKPFNPWLTPEKQPRQMEETGLTLVVKGFRVTGLEGLATNDELQKLIKNEIGKRMGINGLRGVADRVTKYLHEKGWFLARAYIPRQRIKDGIVEIAVIAGRLEGRALIHGNNLRLDQSVLQNMAEPPVDKGCSVNQQDIVRSLLLMNDIPGIHAGSTLEPGGEPGTTKLMVDADEGPLVDGRVWADNYGSRYTDSWHGNGVMEVNDPFRYGDQLLLTTTDNLNYQFGQASYAFPIGYSGLRASVYYGEMRYVVDKSTLDLDLSGGARLTGFTASYPIIRGRTENLWIGAEYDWKNLWDYGVGQPLDYKYVNVGSLHLYGDRLDTFWGGGYNVASISLSGGSLDLSSVPADLQTDSQTAGTNGGYSKFNYAASRLQKLRDRLSLFLSVNGQVGFENLDSSEKFILGGPNGVRAYPVGEAPADSGGIFTAELHYDLPVFEQIGATQLIGFYDLGWAMLWASPYANSGTPIGDRNSYTISGAGVGVNLTKTNLYAVRVAWAHTIGSNPGESLSGADADGKSSDNRFWIQTVFSF